MKNLYEKEEIIKQLHYMPKELKEILEIGNREYEYKKKENNELPEIIIASIIYNFLRLKKYEQENCTIGDIQFFLANKNIKSNYENTCRIIHEMNGFLSYYIAPNEIYSIIPL
jgi:hypothetical protein